MYSCPLLLCLPTKEKPPIFRRSVVDDKKNNELQSGFCKVT